MKKLELPKNKVSKAARREAAATQTTTSRFGDNVFDQISRWTVTRDGCLLIVSHTILYINIHI